MTLFRGDALVTPPVLLTSTVLGVLGDCWRVASPIVYRSAVAGVGVVTVPAGFITDLASVPRLPLTYLLAGGTAHVAAVIHDWLYASKPVDRRTADAVFLEVMQVTGVPAWRAWLMYGAVRVAGWRAWAAGALVVGAMLACVAAPVEAASATPVLTPADVPVPYTLAGWPPDPGVTITSLGAPAVVRQGALLYLLAGATIACADRTGSGILLAVSSDNGVTWGFDRWVVLPVATFCTAEPADGDVVAVSDPWSWPGGASTWKFYYTTRLAGGCQGLGFRAINELNVPYGDSNLDILPDYDGCADGAAYDHAALATTGGGGRFWWSDAGSTWSHAITNRDDVRLELQGVPDVEPHALPGGVVEAYAAGAGHVIVRRVRPAGGSWSVPSAVTTLSGQAWDAAGHHAPVLGDGVLYFVGTDATGRGTIGVWR